MRRLAPLAVLLLAASASAADQSRTCAPPTFTPVDEASAKRHVADSHAFYVKLAGDGWYVGDPAFAASGIPVASSPGEPLYTCPMAAGMHDTGDRTAEVVDEYGNVLMTLRGKTLDRDVVKLLGNASQFVPRLHESARAAVAKAKSLADKHRERDAIAMLQPIARLDGWPEGRDARALLDGLSPR